MKHLLACFAFAACAACVPTKPVAEAPKPRVEAPQAPAPSPAAPAVPLTGPEARQYRKNLKAESKAAARVAKAQKPAVPKKVIVEDGAFAWGEQATAEADNSQAKDKSVRKQKPVTKDKSNVKTKPNHSVKSGLPAGAYILGGLLLLLLLVLGLHKLIRGRWL
ncbi:hypothetical protein [Hymenobacter latericus]|uniref:hypothetical protein n=1 Tax=Hymenobacter sp. YIM 151858-1 TaxID=2987688 RepID=UPI002226FE0D|nr:hypothetical protein [Hymenobacter sp. YIM 151858-1]UYZ60133.1 hypothetical protein OIS50_04855 [Hymenobacter sp. YIM 151858-1]